MTNTISFLKAHGLYEKLSDESPIVSARIADMGKATSSDDMRHGFAYSSPIFNSFWDDGKSKPYSKKDSDGYEYEVSSYTSGDFMPKDAVTITNKTMSKSSPPTPTATASTSRADTLLSSSARTALLR